MPPGGRRGPVAGYIARWRPSSVSPRAAAFARDVVAAAGPGGQERAKNLLWAAAKLADYAIGLGLDPVPEVLLHPSVIERFTALRAGAVGGGAADAAHEPAVHRPAGWCRSWHPADAPLPRERAKQPYSAAEIAGYPGAGRRPARARRGGCARPGWSAWAPAPG